MNSSALRQVVVTTALIFVVLSTTPVLSHEATGGQLSAANNSVNSAFSSIYYAEQAGGDISVLVERLNTAIFLAQKADAENATNPSAATTDFSNATTTAKMVSLASTPVSSGGSMARQLHLYESLGTISSTLSVATLAYLKGDRVYRRLWLFVYKNHLVKKNR